MSTQIVKAEKTGRKPQYREQVVRETLLEPHVASRVHQRAEHVVAVQIQSAVQKPLLLPWWSLSRCESRALLSHRIHLFCSSGDDYHIGTYGQIEVKERSEPYRAIGQTKDRGHDDEFKRTDRTGQCLDVGEILG